MLKTTRHLQFDKATQRLIFERDKMCIFCQKGYHMEEYNPNKLDFVIHDVAHFIPKSKLGLGIPENGIWSCRYHHHLMDNGNKNYRKEMLKIVEEYLKSIYPNWNKEDLVYKKWSNYE